MPFYISLWPGWILVVGLGIFIQAHEVEAKTVVSFFGAQDVPLAASNKAAISAVHVAGYRDPLGDLGEMHQSRYTVWCRAFGPAGLASNYWEKPSPKSEAYLARNAG